MPIPDSLRLTVYKTSDPDRLIWVVMAHTWNEQDVPFARMVQHGLVRFSDPDVAGIDAVVRLLVKAVNSQT